MKTSNMLNIHDLIHSNKRAGLRFVRYCDVTRVVKIQAGRNNQNTWRHITALEKGEGGGGLEIEATPSEFQSVFCSEL